MIDNQKDPNIYILGYMQPYGEATDLVQAFYFKSHAEAERDLLNQKYKTQNYFVETIKLS